MSILKKGRQKAVRQNRGSDCSCYPKVIGHMNFFDIVNIYGLIFDVVLILPHIVYRRSHKINKDIYDNKAMYYIDRMGRYGSLFLMAFHIGVLESGFTEPKALMKAFWLISTAVLCLAYLLLWVLFMKQERRWTANLIVAVSAVIIIFSGILQVNTLLLTAGIIYLAGELYVVSRYFANHRG